MAGRIRARKLHVFCSHKGGLMSVSVPRQFLTGLAALLITTIALALALCAGAHAATLPSVSIAVTPSSATVTGPLESGGVNVNVTDTGVKEATVILVALKPGVSLAEAEAFAKSHRSKDPNNVDEVGSIVFDTEANPGAPSDA